MNITDYDKLEVERDALAAQVELMREAATKITQRADSDGVHTNGIMADILNLSGVVNATPNQCLRQIQAHSFKAGFYKAKSVYNCEMGQCLSALNEYVEEYAERVKAGEV